MKRRDCVLAVTAAMSLLGLTTALGADAHRALSPALMAPLAVSARGAASVRATDATAFVAQANWWLGFPDDTLHALILAARHHAGPRSGTTAMLTIEGDALALPLEMQVAAAYVRTKVDSIDLELIAAASRTRVDDGDVDRVVTRAEAEISAALSELQEQRSKTAALQGASREPTMEFLRTLQALWHAGVALARRVGDLLDRLP